MPTTQELAELYVQLQTAAQLIPYAVRNPDGTLSLPEKVPCQASGCPVRPPLPEELILLLAGAAGTTNEGGIGGDIDLTPVTNAINSLLLEVQGQPQTETNSFVTLCKQDAPDEFYLIYMVFDEDTDTGTPRFVGSDGSSGVGIPADAVNCNVDLVQTCRPGYRFLSSGQSFTPSAGTETVTFIAVGDATLTTALDNAQTLLAGSSVSYDANNDTVNLTEITVTAGGGANDAVEVAYTICS